MHPQSRRSPLREFPTANTTADHPSNTTWPCTPAPPNNDWAEVTYKKEGRENKRNGWAAAVARRPASGATTKKKPPVVSSDPRWERNGNLVSGPDLTHFDVRHAIDSASMIPTTVSSVQVNIGRVSGTFRVSSWNTVKLDCAGHTWRVQVGIHTYVRIHTLHDGALELEHQRMGHAYVNSLVSPAEGDEIPHSHHAALFELFQSELQSPSVYAASGARPGARFDSKALVRPGASYQTKLRLISQLTRKQAYEVYGSYQRAEQLKTPMLIQGQQHESRQMKIATVRRRK